MNYDVTIGLEVHAELNTDTKIYCGCKNSFGAEVNTQCCPVCMGLPGTLPTLNEKVVDYAIMMGHALNCSINNVTKQDRKNYIYPDLPKAYQISQFDIPLCENGYVEFMLDGEKKRVGITRIHIEEDAGKLIHDDKFDGSLVDFNRCGVPLIEIVSEPDITSSAMAKAYLDTIKSILQYINISDCKMQEGSIRCDVNVSIKPEGSDKLGTRCEMKNVNTFSGAVRAIDFEVERQIKLLESGEQVTQQTRRWDDLKGESFLMRTKEDAQDYRYFPEPDLKTIYVEEERVNFLKQLVPELPNVKIERFVNEYKLLQIDATVLAENIDKCEFFEQAVGLEKVSPKSVANWVLGEISKTCNEKKCEVKDLGISVRSLVDLIALIENKTISTSAGKQVFEEMLAGKTDPAQIVKDLGLAQVSDTGALEAIVDQVLAENEKAVEDFKNGKTNVLGFLVGQCMKKSKGQGNPGILKELLTNKLQ
ncbi:MAG: Asp-tRNA(Asn)/Glu-tRNA(Gln) amidotransferase subunit GatB [Oscillospiraceae bacterium]|nr:Asp-tRNA(Asn)/Glu-tRNA(Gln) amidotransferase subunit GatB [Oscillospiraceae bacterium]